MRVRATTCVGVIADTHGLFRPDVTDALAGVDLIVHAGDVGGGAVLARLTLLAPTVAVCGNVDDPHDPALAPARVLPVGGLTLHVSHGHELGSPTPARLLSAYGSAADIIVFGHTHRSLVLRETIGDRHVLLVNPGSAGPKRFTLPASVVRLTVSGRHASAEVVTLGP